ncbi:HNH endonuclease [Streptomyces sp. NPDC020917]|uniref:HNH endonuclease n=1 Tax=Streptomyces sp. NPDC020917 TaxID=3365102 RepID=UPI00378F33D3
MSNRRQRPCLGCARLTRNPSRCDNCTAIAERQRSQRRGKTTARGYGYAWQHLRARLIAEHVAIHGQWCPGFEREAHTAERLSVDHIVPRTAGGTDDRENLQVLCLSCNSRKRDRTV